MSLNANGVSSQIGAVVIGRNEGKRLIACIESLAKYAKYIVYVDSGSTDGSLEAVKKFGISVVSLDMSIPFTAARARNEGADYLLHKHDGLKYLQFIDGDCELQAGWIESASQFLDENDIYAIACGRRRERFPEKSIYNQLCDIEWDTPIGDALACGGDALIRVEAFKQVNGYREDLIAGEEPEMCFRLRKQSWNIRRIDVEMTLHDAGMTKATQWWNRAKRAGYAYAESCYLHGRSEEKFRVKQVVSILVWGCFIPGLALLLSFYNVNYLFLFLFYPLQVWRLTVKNQLNLVALSQSGYYALTNVGGKFPQALGVFKFILNKLGDRRATLIEYK